MKSVLVQLQFAFVLILCSSAVFANASRPRAVLFTSISVSDRETEQQADRVYQWKLEKIFADAFKNLPEFILVHKHRATQYDLWQAIRDPQNRVIFWLSHSNAPKNIIPGVRDSGIIADIQGFDITPLFGSFHPWLRVLGIIGCSNSKVVKNLLNSVSTLSFDRLAWVAYGTEVDAQQGLRNALEIEHDNFVRAETHFFADQPKEVEETGYPLTIRRKIPWDQNRIFPAVRVEHSGRVLGVFPEGRAGEEQEIQIILRVRELGLIPPKNPPGPKIHSLQDVYGNTLSSRRRLKLVFNSGKNPVFPLSRVEIGSFEFSQPWPDARWEAFRGPTGRPIGVFENIYEYEGPLNIDAEPEELFPYGRVSAQVLTFEQ